MNQEKIDRILQLIKNDKPQEDHLFKMLATSENPISLLIPLKETSYFSPDKNPAPIEDPHKKGNFTIPYWNVLGYLENVAMFNNKKNDKKVTNIIIEIIDALIDYHTEIGERIDNYRTDWVLTKMIFLLPINKIKHKYFEFIKTALKSKWGTTLISSEIGDRFLPYLIEKNAKSPLLKLLQILFEHKINEDRYVGEYISIIDHYWLRNALQKNKKSIALLCPLEATKIALWKINSIVKKDKSQFNNIWIPTIEDHPQTKFPDRYECQLVFFVRDMLELAKPDEISEMIIELSKKKHPIFRRIVIHIIDYHYKELNKLFWQQKKNPLNDRLLTHELFELLKNNCSSFSSKQMGLVIKWIEGADYSIYKSSRSDEAQTTKIIAYQKKIWISALLNTKVKKVTDLYNKHNKINSAQISHPGHMYWSESSWGSISPVNVSDLIAKSSGELVDYLIFFHEENVWRAPSVEGLSDTLKKYVAEYPNKFTDDVIPFLKVKRNYQYALLWGISEAWRANKDFEWKTLFLFISRILESDDFWDEQYDQNTYHYRNMIISQIADLINDGTQNDNHAFNYELLSEAEKILLLLVKKAESNYHDMNDIVTSVLNSNKGKIFAAMINYSLRCARLNTINKNGRWVKTIKDDFTNRLDRSVESSLEFSVILGEYLPNLYALDKEWSISNIDLIFLKVDEIYWKAAFTGYLFYAVNVYAHLYKLLTQKDHYKKALDTDFADDHVVERLIQHICVAYLEDWEKLNDYESLISNIIRSNNLKFLSAIVEFFWMLRDDAPEKLRNKIKPLWKELYLRLKSLEANSEYQELIADFSRWLVFIDEIDDDVFEWLTFSVKHINSHIDSTFLIEYLLKHADKTPGKVGDLYITVLISGYYPEYKQEHIIELIAKLNSNKQREKALKICNLYLNNGLEFVRSVLESISVQ